MLLPIVALVFLSVFILLAALGLSLADRHFSPRTELKRRLQHLAALRAPEELGETLSREVTRADRFLSRFSLTRNLAKRLQHAGMEIPAAAFVALTASAVLVCAALAALATGKALAGAAAAAAVAGIALLLVRARTEKRNRSFTQQFPDTLSMISRSLRAGHSLTTAVQLVGQEIPAPAGTLFKEAYDQQQLGLRMTDALGGMNHKIESLDLRFFTTAVSINAEVGGNLADVLDKLASTIRDRLRIRRQVQVYTAQGRMSGYVLGALPVVAFGMFSVLNPEYESALIREPMGLYVLFFAALMQLAGILVIRKIIRIRI